MPHKPLPAPLYMRIYGLIFQRIQQGEYPPGSTLNTEDQFAAEFNVSKATVRQAVGELVERGIVIRRQGKGTYVREDLEIRPPHQIIGSLADLILGTRSMSVANQEIEERTFPVDIQSILGISGVPGTTIRHLRLIDNTPFAFTAEYLAPVVSEYIKASELRAGGHATLLNDRGLRILGASQSMSAELADPEVALHLNIDFGAPVLFAERVVHSDRGPVEVSHTWYRGDLYKWHADLEFSWSGTGVTVSTRAAATSPR
ncbi:GntR family transcriptional regulator [Dactylosporangium fulvum]